MVQSAGDGGNASLQAILQSVQSANQTWKAAGVQFWVRSIERYVMPHFYNMAPSPNLDWTTVQPELVGPNTAFPNAPTNAWQNISKDKPTWLRAVTAVYAAQNEVTVWLKDDDGHGYYCRFPNEGRDCVWNGHTLTNGDVREPAHELGHYLGLVHTFDVNNHKDPSTQQPFKLSDRWDMVFKQGTSAANPNTYYHMGGLAALDEASLHLIDIKNQPNCTRDNTGVVSCDIGNASYSEHLTEQDNGMQGTAFWHLDGHGDNVMSYLEPRLPPRDISDSQIAIVRKFLRWDEPFDSTSYNSIYEGFTKTVTVTSGERPQLGNWTQRQPAGKLDFDGDGLRDIGVWIPPTSIAQTGEFIVLLSSHGYNYSAGQYMDVHLGGLGDTPVPADYSGDGRTDLAVFQPGGGINRDDLTNTAGYWRWCATASPAETTTCSSPTVVHYGERYDVPEPGLNFGGDTADAFAIYRRSNSTWYFKQPSWSSSRAVSMSSRPSAVPLPGLYDCDDKADLALYEPTSAKFKLVQSSTNWNPSQMITRQFSSDLIPHNSGSPTSVAGAVPVAGQRYLRFCGSYPFFSIVPRLSAVLFFPQNGSWYMNMDPVGESTVNVCAFGDGREMPIGGTDWNGDGKSDMAYFATYDTNSLGIFWGKPTTWSDCSGYSTTTQFQNITRPRQRAYGVPDMTGDGVNDILVIDPDYGIVRWLTSDDGYHTENLRLFASSYMEVL